MAALHAASTVPSAAALPNRFFEQVDGDYVPFAHNPQDKPWIVGRLSTLPESVHEAIGRTYQHKFNADGAHDGEKRRNANLFLLGLADKTPHVKFNSGKRLNFRFNLSDAEIRSKAFRLSLRCRSMVKQVDQSSKQLEVALALYEYQGFDPDDLKGFDDVGIINRLSAADFWRRKLTKRQDRVQETLLIQLGNVCKQRGLYISAPMFTRIQERVRRSFEYMATMQAECLETGETLDMLNVLKGSVANPEVRRAELMVRMRGFEDYAKSQEHEAVFYTLTCPSKFHRYTLQGKRAVDNPAYADYNPRQAQNYLNTIWKRIRAKLKRDNLQVYGFRVAEPHHDGCPHWHMVLFMRPSDVLEVNAVIRDYALREDGDEKGAVKHRFTVKRIDPAKGSATGYIAKYVSKNINGFEVGMDYEGGMDAADSSKRVLAWASLWGIRQFQQLGGAPVGLWRELRRLKEEQQGLLEEARKAADVGDWCKYLELQGGALAPRKAQPMGVYTQEQVDTETGEIITNRYGEIVERVAGIECLGEQVKTRLHQWSITQKPETTPKPVIHEHITYKQGFSIYNKAKAEPDAVLSSSLRGEAARPWSTGNNCTQSIKVREPWVKLPDVKPDNSTTETVKQPNYKGRLRKWELKPQDKAQKLRDAPHLFAKSVRDYDRSTPNH